MELQATKTSLKNILPFRDLFLQEMNAQVRYNACHERNWSDSYLLLQDGIAIGYGSVKGKDKLADRDAVFEFYVIPPYRRSLREVFEVLLMKSGALFIECQSNDPLLASMLYDFSANINSDVVLFKENFTTKLDNPNVVFRERKEKEIIFGHTLEPVGDYVLEYGNEVVATGGFMLYYNIPFADLYMEVREDMRRRGFGAFLLQEIKKQCYLKGRVPAARCNADNTGSKASLARAGFAVAGFMLTGDVHGLH